MTACQRLSGVKDETEQRVRLTGSQRVNDREISADESTSSTARRQGS